MQLSLTGSLPKMINPLLMAPKRLMQFVDTVLLALRKVSWTALLLTGLAVAIATTASSLLIPIKLVAVLVAAGGSSVGTAIVTLVIPKLTGIKLEQARNALREETSKHLTAETELAKHRKERIAYLQTKEELLRLRRLRIDVSPLQPLQELGLAGIPIAATHLVRKTLSESETDGISEYVGAFHVSAFTKWGIDLNQTRIRQLDDGRLEVSGVSCVYLGSKDEKSSVLLSEIRDRKSKSTGFLWLGKPKTVVELRSSRGSLDGADWAAGSIEAQSHEDEFRRDLLSRVTSGALSPESAMIVRRFGEEWLQRTLAPLGRQLVFVEHPSSEGRGFVEFFKAHNQAMDRRIAALETKARAIKGLLEGAVAPTRPSPS